MDFKFRFRKFISNDDATASAIFIEGNTIKNPPAFSTAVEYLAYNSATNSGTLLSKWFDAIVLSAPLTDEEYQQYFTREWVENEGVEVYLPNSKKHKASKNDIEMLIYTTDKKAVRAFNDITQALNAWGVFEYYDNYNKGLKRLVYEGFTIIKDMQRDGNRVIHFKIKCNNILGYDNKNFNPSAGGQLW